MSYSLVVGRKATNDLKRAVYWYEDQRNGLGDRFAAEVRGTMRKIIQRPHLPATIGDDVRRVRVGRWPYFIFYRVRGDQVIVLAILHGHRDPDIWQQRIQDDE